jgi:hypothetical protein
VLGGDEGKQIVAMRDYIMSLGNAAGVAVTAEAAPSGGEAPAAADPNAPDGDVPPADDQPAA